jgi:DNA topoisomerase-1
MAARSHAPRLKDSNLQFVRCDIPGITRRKRGDGFAYYGPDGNLIRDRHVITRLKRLAIPPAYRDVWICPHADGHLQAVGRDDRGRRQYRYHEN